MIAYKLRQVKVKDGFETMVDIQLSENCKSTLNDDCWKECIRCNKRFLEKYWDEELDWYIELNVSDECTDCQNQPANV